VIARWGAASLALVPLAALLCLSCSTNSEKRDDHLAEAEGYLEEGKTNEAVFELRHALRFDPQNADVHYRIAEVLIGNGDAGGALFHFREARRLDPTRTDASIKAAGIIFLEDPDAADALVDEVLAAEPSNAGAYIVRSKAALVREDIDASLRAALKAVELSPEDPTSHVQLGKVHQARIRKGQIEKKPVDDAVFEAALAAFARAHELSEETFAWMGLQHGADVLSAWPGHAQQAKQAHREAMQAAEKAGDDARRTTIGSSLTYGQRTGDLDFQAEMLEAFVPLVPGDVDRWFQLASVEEARGRSGEEVLQRMLETLSGDAQAHLRYARHLIYAEGRLDEGLAHLETKANAGVEPPVLLSALVARLLDAQRLEEAGRIVERLEREHPDDSNTALARASLELDLGRTEEAAEQLRVVLGRSQSPGAWQLLAQAEYRRGNLPEALEAIANAIALAQSLGTPFPQRALRLQAHLQVASQDFVGALRSFHQLQRHGAPMAARDRQLQARALYGLERREAARGLLEAMMADTRSQPIAAMELAELDFVERPDEARAAITRALEAQPSHPGLLLWAARLDLASGDPRRAIERVETAIAAKTATPALLLERARALASTGNVEHAQRDALRAFELDPNLEGGAELLMVLFESKEGDPQKVIASFEEADAVGALQPPARYLLARLHKRNGNRERAKALLEELATTDLAFAKSDLAYLLAEDGADLTRAQELAEEATRELRGRPESLHTLGYVLFRRGLHAPALEQFRLAQPGLSRSDPLVHYHTGLALQELGRLGEAEEAFALALEGGMGEAEQALEEVRAAKADTQAGPS
jgi:tetratricopeptide (TPR) repeat protein